MIDRWDGSNPTVALEKTNYQALQNHKAPSAREKWHRLPACVFPIHRLEAYTTSGLTLAQHFNATQGGFEIFVAYMRFDLLSCFDMLVVAH